MHHAKDHPYFTTITCLEWKHVIESDAAKEIILDSLNFLVSNNRVSIYAFCLMNNHIHLIWQMLGDHFKANVQRDFLKYTGQRILEHLREVNPSLLQSLEVSASDRKFQVWERNALSVPLYSEKFFQQKLFYIHQNPVEAGLCEWPEDYYYSSAKFYLRNVRTFNFLEYYNG